MNLSDALAAAGNNAKVLFTAPSTADEQELRAEADAIARTAGVREWSGWTLVWQDDGRGSLVEVTAVIADLAATGRATGVVIHPLRQASSDLSARTAAAAGRGSLMHVYVEAQ